MTTKLRAGVIGCGSMARHHIAGYLACGRYELAAIADRDATAMADVDRDFGVSPVHYRTPARCSTASGWTWSRCACGTRGTRRWTIAAAARRPRAILCEKPMAETLGRAEEMLVACRRNRVKLAIGHQRRFLPAYTLARDLIARGAIGTVQLMLSFGGQGLPNYSSHQTDMFRYLLGDDECRWVMGNVERKTDRYERTTRIEDCAVAVFEFARGARALILADVAPLMFQGAHIYGDRRHDRADTVGASAC